jgi:hypothetical protein
MTQLLNEMIQLHEAKQLNESLEMLLEFLGNLAAIDKHLLKSIKQSVTTNRYGGKASDKIVTALGQQSAVNHKPVTGRNSDSLWNSFEEDSTVVAMVLVYGGNQIMAVSNRARLGVSIEKGSEACFAVMTPDFFEKVMPEADFNEKFNPKVKKYQSPENKMRSVLGGSREGKTFIRNVLDIMIKKAKADGITVEAAFIHKDEERVKAKSARAAARSGRVITPNEKGDVAVGGGRYGRSENIYKNYIDGLKSSLRARLDAFKTSKAKDFTSIAEMLEYIKKEGYLDKLKVNGVDYVMKDSRMYLDELIKSAKKAPEKDSYRNDSYVSYSMEYSDYYDAREKERAKYKDDLAAAKDDEEATQKIRDKIESSAPPRTIKVMFALKGGLIVPADVKIEQH